ncbi:MAG: carboxypeptidase regulatory-like domain-containing protein [Nitrospirae bacterium]|nr:carboxypeptidase regulatory-like domain-containing protein [Nitrospirota bacterium]
MIIGKMTITKLMLLAMLIALPSGLVFAEMNSDTMFQTGSVNGINYIAGGIGLDEREALSAIAGSKYNVKLVFALIARNYVSDIPIEITNKSGKKVLEVISSGPVFYVNLPPGAYTVRASYEGVAITHHINAGSAAARQVVFGWR